MSCIFHNLMLKKRGAKKEIINQPSTEKFLLASLQGTVSIPSIKQKIQQNKISNLDTFQY